MLCGTANAVIILTCFCCAISGTQEVQTVRTFSEHVDEVQRLTIWGVDINEIQVIRVTDNSTGPDPLVGAFKLMFDSRREEQRKSPTKDALL